MSAKLSDIWLRETYPGSTLCLEEESGLWLLDLSIDPATAARCYLRAHVVLSTKTFREKVKELSRIASKEIEEEVLERKVNKTLHSLH